MLYYFQSLSYYLRNLIIATVLLCSLQAHASPAITPSCPVDSLLELDLKHTTYNTNGYNSYPVNHTQYNTLVASYAIPSKLFGYGRAYDINGSGNPFGNNDNYLSLFTGYIEAPTTGIYGIGIDGDDAVEVIIDGTIITGWYGGHGRAGSAQYTVNISLDIGYHTIEFRHQERGGGDNYYLYWKKPGDAGYSIVPNNRLSSCTFPPYSPLNSLILKPAISPSCPSPNPQLQLSTYNTVGYNSFPSDHSQYNSLLANYAITSKLFGSGLVSTINGSGNPYGVNDNYLSLFKGYLQAPVTGVYYIGIDGDDAIEVLIDGDAITGWYGGHGRAGSAQYITPVKLQAGYHNIEFRHQERTGGDNYYLYWQKPSDVTMSITSAAYLSHCTNNAIVSLKKTSKTLSDPVNGTANPKAIPGAVIEYTLTAHNSGGDPSDNSTISDSLNNLITTQQSASWAGGYTTIQTPNFYGGVKTTLTDVVDADQGQFNDTAGNRVLSVDCGTISTGQSCVITYRIIIN